MLKSVIACFASLFNNISVANEQVCMQQYSHVVVDIMIFFTVARRVL